ncbi:hypothetical protein B0H16DRAFT_1741048 [Mycena metata]|uniref:Uncharacterized protein n=1 Tax=Mycena metata TaxID=1033252 RepID=A0AAD7MHT1_9AGAR|nr:hypothetical protein B0H16DRAFT_1741048 [Mycena metata]
MLLVEEKPKPPPRRLRPRSSKKTRQRSPTTTTNLKRKSPPKKPPPKKGRKKEPSRPTPDEPPANELLEDVPDEGEFEIPEGEKDNLVDLIPPIDHEPPAPSTRSPSPQPSINPDVPPVHPMGTDPEHPKDSEKDKAEEGGKDKAPPSVPPTRSPSPRRRLTQTRRAPPVPPTHSESPQSLPNPDAPPETPNGAAKDKLEDTAKDKADGDGNKEKATLPVPPANEEAAPPVPPTGTQSPSNKDKGKAAPETVADPHAPPNGPKITLDGAPWAVRNPDAPTQPPLKKPAQKPVLGEAEKATAQLKKALKAKEKAEFEAEVADFMKEMSETSTRLAKKFDKSEHDVKKALRGRSNVFVERNASLHNAKVWKFSSEINEGRAAGDNIRPPELQELLKKDEKYQSMTAEEETLLLQEHAEYRGIKKDGARLSNTAGARDVTAFVRCFVNDAVALHHQTGAFAFITVGRSNVNNSIQPGCSSPPEALQFFPRMMKQTPGQFGLKFDNYTCNMDAANLELSYQDLRRDTTAAITTALERCINRKVPMCYGEYDRFIQEIGNINIIDKL